jgi:hypothetical protein
MDLRANCRPRLLFGTAKVQNDLVEDDNINNFYSGFPAQESAMRVATARWHSIIAAMPLRLRCLIRAQAAKSRARPESSGT